MLPIQCHTGRRRISQVSSRKTTPDKELDLNYHGTVRYYQHNLLGRHHARNSLARPLKTRFTDSSASCAIPPYPRACPYLLVYLPNSHARHFFLSRGEKQCNVGAIIKRQAEIKRPSVLETLLSSSALNGLEVATLEMVRFVSESRKWTAWFTLV